MKGKAHSPNNKETGKPTKNPENPPTPPPKNALKLQKKPTLKQNQNYKEATKHVYYPFHR